MGVAGRADRFGSDSAGRELPFRLHLTLYRKAVLACLLQQADGMPGGVVRG